MNRIMLIGRLTRDPESKVIEESGRTITRFTLAVERPFRANGDERGVDFIPIVFFGRRAEILAQYMTKGKLLSVSGRLQIRSYEANDGIKKYIAEVLADEFQFVEPKNEEKEVAAQG